MTLWTEWTCLEKWLHIGICHWEQVELLFFFFFHAAKMRLAPWEVSLDADECGVALARRGRDWFATPTYPKIVSLASFFSLWFDDLPMSVKTVLLNPTDISIQHVVCILRRAIFFFISLNLDGSFDFDPWFLLLAHILSLCDHQHWFASHCPAATEWRDLGRTSFLYLYSRVK